MSASVPTFTHVSKLELDVEMSRLLPTAFPVAGAKVWNSLPSDVTSASSLHGGVQEQAEDICSTAATKLFDLFYISLF